MHGGEAVLAGFGILRFVVHSCGLHYITLSPLLLRVSSRACACACQLVQSCLPAGQFQVDSSWACCWPVNNAGLPMEPY